MSLVHDLAESIVGDIAPCDGISKEKKFAMEETQLNP
jgi:5'-deoxynucleotidase YfbR-like HD superfamily hydrolase